MVWQEPGAHEVSKLQMSWEQGTLLMIPRVLPAQQCGAILLSTVHELVVLRVSKPNFSAIDGAIHTKNHMLAPKAVAVKR